MTLLTALPSKQHANHKSTSRLQKYFLYIPSGLSGVYPDWPCFDSLSDKGYSFVLPILARKKRACRKNDLVLLCRYEQSPKQEAPKKEAEYFHLNSRNFGTKMSKFKFYTKTCQIRNVRGKLLSTSVAMEFPHFFQIH